MEPFGCGPSVAVLRYGEVRFQGEEVIETGGEGFREDFRHIAVALPGGDDLAGAEPGVFDGEGADLRAQREPAVGVGALAALYEVGEV